MSNDTQSATEGGKDLWGPYCMWTLSRSSYQIVFRATSLKDMCNICTDLSTTFKTLTQP